MYDWRADVRARLGAARLHPQDEAELVEEMSQHLEAQYTELAAQIGSAAARERLLADLRDVRLDEAVARVKHRAKPPRARIWASASILRDVRYGLRSLRRSPGMLAAGIIALALGIGLTTVMYSVIYGLLLKGLPFQGGSRIVMIYRTDPRGRGEEDLVPFADYVRYRSEQRSFAAFGAYTQGTASISGGDRPERVTVARLTAGVMDVTGVRAIIGRTFVAADNAPDAPPTAIIDYATWRDRFRGDSGVIGTTVRVNGTTHTVIGVMPDGFAFPRAQQLWLPLQLDSSALRPGEGTPVTLVGRLRANVDLAAANAELAGLSQRLAREHDDTAAVRDLAQPFVRATIPARVYSLLYAMLGAVFLVLLVACANVANLLLDRAANRTREMGIRLALGASRIALVRQSLVESGILALLAAIVGAGLAQIGITIFTRAVATLQTDRPPFWMDVRLHVPVLLFVLALAVVASIVSGVLPALHSARFDINAILKDESHAASSLRVGRLSRVIVIGEIALSSALLLGAGFMTKSILRLRSMDPGFSTSDVLTTRVTLSSGDSTQRRQFFESLEAKLAAVSGLESVYLGDGLPGTQWNGSQVAIEGHTYERPRDKPITRVLAVSPGFFRTFGITMLQGRPIVAADRVGSANVAVISESFARRLFPNIDPIGRRIRLGSSDAGGDWLTVVGIIPTLYADNPQSMQNRRPPEVLTALWQAKRISSVSVAIRGPRGVANAATLRRAVGALEPDVPVYAIATMDQLFAETQWPVDVFGTMFVIFGIVSLSLAAIGLYAVMTFSVSRRIRELGIRMALGATTGNVIRMVCRQGAVQLVIGMSLGFILGSLIVRGARAVLFGVEPSDPTVFALVASVLAAAAFIACIIPAVGATRVDPVVTLKSE